MRGSGSPACTSLVSMRRDDSDIGVLRKVRLSRQYATVSVCLYGETRERAVAGTVPAPGQYSRHCCGGARERAHRAFRSEERRVGKECRAGGWLYVYK